MLLFYNNLLSNLLLKHRQLLSWHSGQRINICAYAAGRGYEDRWANWTPTTGPSTSPHVEYLSPGFTSVAMTVTASAAAATITAPSMSSDSSCYPAEDPWHPGLHQAHVHAQGSHANCLACTLPATHWAYRSELMPLISPLLMHKLHCPITPHLQKTRSKIELRFLRY